MENPELLPRAVWIWPESPMWDLHNGYALFRKRFTLEKAPKSAPLEVTADQSYRLYINGRFVCRGPARGFQSHWPYDRLDVAEFLKAGDNVLAIRAYNPGCSNFQYLTQGWAGILLALQAGKQTIVTDATWKCRRQSGIVRDTVPTSLQLFPQEHLDARVEADEWAEPEFDDSHWAANAATTLWNAMPYYQFEPRGIPLLREWAELPRTLAGVAEGRCAAGYRATRDVCRTRFTEGLAHAPADGIADVLDVPAIGVGQYRSFLIDFGRTVVGNLVVAVDGAAAGTIVDTLHVETIDPTTRTPDYIPESGCRMAFGYRLIARAGSTRHVFYHPYGFRYAVVTVRDAVKGCRVSLSLNAVGYPLERVGGFAHSDRLLEAIWETSAWTQQCCMLDAYVDTPWREQAQWWGDARVQAWNTFHLSSDPRLFRRGIHSIASQQLENGLTYGHAPTMAHGCILPDFTLVWALTLWDHFWQTGEIEAFETHRETLEKALGYFVERIDSKTGLVGYDPRYWLFLDWTGVFRDGYPALLNLWLLETLEKMAILYALAGRKRVSGALSKRAKRLRKTLRGLIGDDGLMRDGVAWDGTIVDSASVHSQTLALMTRLSSKSEAAMLEKSLVPFLRREVIPEVHPSAYWITYVFTELAKRGFGEDVIAYIKERWAPMVAQGTTWENFAPVRGEESFSHAWSAHPIYHFAQILGGIWQAAPGWAQVVFAPVFAGVRCRNVVPTPRGEIVARWERHGDLVAVSLALPRGVEAAVHLLGIAPEVVTGEREWQVAG